MTSRGDGKYEAEIRWTTHGVAHIRAADWGGLGFGQGFAAAGDHLPTIADQVVKVRSERSRFYGPGPHDQHVASDFGYMALGVVDHAARLRDTQSPEVRDLIAGYVAGYNAWLAEPGARESLPTWCADAEWIRPIDELDLYAFLGDVALMASGRNLAGIIGRAEAPGADGPLPASPISALAGDAGASNGWALGRDVTASGHGIVVANPHCPWEGEARFWESHLTIPGHVDVYGVSLIGTPGVQMGFNEGLAWAHTFSAGHRFTLARLDLAASDPTRYRYGDDERAMSSTTYEVAVRGDGGGMSTVERTLWRSHHGPMVNLPLLGWGLEVGFTCRDANADNTAVFEQFLGMDRATSIDEFKKVFADVQGLPWVNTLAADRSGRTWYIDGSPTPNLTPEAQERFTARIHDDVVAALLYENKVALLDGSDPGDDWIDEPGARNPGLVPHHRLPQLERTDYVANANDSHWLTNPSEPLEGYSILHGYERTPRTLRTRQNLRVLERLASQRGVTTVTALEQMLDGAGLSAELLLDETVARCRAAGTVEHDGSKVDVGAAAEVLAGWDGKSDLDAVGAALWREVTGAFTVKQLCDCPELWATRFDPDDPVQTPSGLADLPATGADPIVAAVARAVVALDAAGVAL
ncbi:MAG TPA: penicillin acylase family protein, partial [Acidimicrobiales bacterium]